MLVSALPAHRTDVVGGHVGVLSVLISCAAGINQDAGPASTVTWVADACATWVTMCSLVPMWMRSPAWSVSARRLVKFAAVMSDRPWYTMRLRDGPDSRADIFAEFGGQLDLELGCGDLSGRDCHVRTHWLGDFAIDVGHGARHPAARMTSAIS